MKKLSVLFLALCLTLCGCASRPVSGESFALDTFITVTLYDGTQADVDAALARVDGCDRLLSAHRQDSDIGRVNASDGQALAVDPLTAEIISQALSIGQNTDGALDITLYAVSSLWDYKSQTPTVPTEEQLSQALTHTGRDRVRVDTQISTLRVDGVQLDLGAIAKGAIGDEVVKTLTERGVTCALLNLGGNIFTLGTKRDGSPWVVAIDSPFEQGQYIGRLTFAGSAVVATSSGAQRFFIKDGVRYHHILDPKTGLPARSGLASVTVLAQGGLLADALSTALFVLGEEKAETVLTQFYPDVSAVLVRQDGTVRVLGSAEFQAEGE